MASIEIFVPDYLIQDGQCDFPTVGASAEYYLGFHESTESARPWDTVLVVDVELSGDGRPIQGLNWDGSPSAPPTYAMRVRGPGFVADFASPVPREGEQRLRGHLWADFGALRAPAVRITGRVVRTRLVIEAHQRDGSGTVIGIDVTDLAARVRRFPPWTLPHNFSANGADYHCGVLVDLVPHT